jgi:hypothetical protein
MANDQRPRQDEKSLAGLCPIDFDNIHTYHSRVVVFKKSGDRVGTKPPLNEKGANHFLANPSLYLAPQRGLEPRTRWLTAICSTD